MDCELVFKVQGSEAEPYNVVFRRRGLNLTATCTCKGGEMGQVCKHRLGLLAGDSSNVVSDNALDVALIPKLVLGTDVEKALEALVVAEKALEAAKIEMSRRKKALARAFLD